MPHASHCERLRIESLPAWLTIASLLLLVSLPSAAFAGFDKQERRCRSALAGAAQRVAKSALETISTCHKERDQGRIGAATDCNNLAAADTKRKMDRGERKLLAVPAKKCLAVVPAAMGVSVCGCDGSAIASMEDFAQCLLCTAENRMTVMATVSMGSPDPLLLGDAGALQCHAAIAKAQARFFDRVLKLHSRCQRKQEKAGASDNVWCQDSANADPKGRGSRARARAESVIDGACRGVNNLTELDSCSEQGISQLKACVLDDAAASAAEAFVAFYPTTLCGDGAVGVGEQCDDGNNISGDGCSADCLEESCTEVAGSPVYLWCPPNSSPDSSGAACRCDPGFEPDPSGCVDIDECANSPGICQGVNSGVCVNVSGSYSCATDCTAAAFEASLASCGAPSGVITFDCTNTTIGLANSAGWAARQISCDGLTIDGLDRNITFELTPACSVVAGALCPDENNGVGFLVLGGDFNTVRNLTIRNFFEGIHTVGSYNTVASVVLDGQCDDSITSRGAGVGNLFRDLMIMNGCDKCTQNRGDPTATGTGVCPASAYNAIYDEVSFVDCVQPLRMTAAGRFLVRNSSISVSDGRCDGPRFSGGRNGDLIVYMEGNVIDGCDRGVRVVGKSQVILRGNTIRNGSRRGVLVGVDGRALLEGTTIIDNGGGPPGAEHGYGGVAVADRGSVDLGGGTLVIDAVAMTSVGGNTLCGNLDHVGGRGRQDLENLTSNLLAASANWWCDSIPADQIFGPAQTAPILPVQP